MSGEGADAQRVARVAIEEDLGPGDVTTLPTIGAALSGRGHVLAKSDLVVAGHPYAQAVFAEVDARLGGQTDYAIAIPDGEAVAAGTVIATVRGPLRNIVIGERPALNLLMKLCGIATNTQRYTQAASDSGLRVLDTRKTTPGLRQAEKYAVRCGGGTNHRHALFDGVMVKDNHITAAGGLTAAVAAARAHAHHLMRIEVEVRTLEELDQALTTEADVILLDNMDDATLQEAVRRARAQPRRVWLEASGNMTPERIGRIRDLGLDFVSAGGLIHQAVWADLSLKIEPPDA